MMIKTILTAIIWLLIVNIFALFVLNRFNLLPDTAYKWISPNDFFQKQSWDLVSLHSRWDSFWYLDIAQNGYQYKGENKLSNIVFFPLYPLLLKIVSFMTFGSLELSGWIVSIISLIVSCIFLYKLTKDFHPSSDPFQAVMFLLIFPSAFFLNSIYTESLFLALSLATFYYAFKKKFVIAAVTGFLASLTRLNGLLLFIPLAWEYYRFFGIRGFFDFRLLFLLAIPFGTFCFFLFHFFVFGDLLLFFKVESWWGRNFTINKEHFELLSNPSVVNFLLDMSFLGTFIFIVFFVFKKLRISYGLYMLTSIIFALSTGTLMSINRYVLVLFPVYILMASLKSNLFRQTWTLISILLLGMYIALYVNNYWAG